MPGMIRFFVVQDGYSAAPEGYLMPGTNLEAWTKVLDIFDPFRRGGIPGPCAL